MNPIAALVILAAMPAGGQYAPSEPVLMELRLGRLASQTVPAYRSGDAVLLPIMPFFSLAELRAERSADGVIRAVLQPGNRKLVIHPAGTLEIDGQTRRLLPGEFLAEDGELFLNCTLLAEMIGVRFELSWADLEITIADPEKLPIGRRQRRAQAAAARLQPGQVGYVDGRLQERPSTIDGLITDYSFLVPTRPGPKDGAYSFTLGLAALKGDFVASIQNEGPLDDGHARVDASWTGVWPDQRWLAQLRLGDGYATGPRTRSVRGVTVSNAPFRRPAILGQLPFVETLGPGWELEAYRGGRLIAFDSVNALGQFTLDVPIQYGENPVDFIAYGPFGEVRQFNRTYRVSAEVIPAGRFEYAVSAGACRGVAPCDATGNVDLRVGITPRITAYAGYDGFWRDTLSDLSHPYLGFVAGITNSFVAEAELAGAAIARGQIRYEPSNRLLLSLEATRFARDVEAPILTIPGRRGQFTFYGIARPFTGVLGNRLVLDASVDRTLTADEGQTTARLGGSYQSGQLRLMPTLRWEASGSSGPSSSRLGWGMNAILLPVPQLRGFAGQITTRAGIDFEGSFEARSASLFLSRPLSRWIRMEIGGSWFRGQRAGLMALFAADLPQARVHSTIERAPDGSVGARQFFQGSVLYDRAGHVVLNAGPSAHQGGVSGRVFLDRNQNGRFDADEQLLRDVEVMVGLFSQRTNADGEFRIWPLAAYDPVIAAVDTATLASPLWLPTYGGIELMPTPNRFTPLNIPVLPGAVIEGTVRRITDTDTVAVAGADVILRHLATGRSRRIRTFSDGSFYAMSIRPGEWTAEVDPGVLARLGRRSEPVRFTVGADEAGTSISGLELRLR
jgi:hypothetical protein